MLTERCSSLPRRRLCPAAAAPATAAIGGASPEGRLGSAFHHAMRLAIECGYYDAAMTADTFGVEVADLEKLMGLGWNRWEQLGTFFPEPFFEVEMVASDDDLRLTAHADLMSVLLDERELRGLDWKSGMADEDHSWQMKGYAWCGLQKYPELDRARWVTVGVRAGTADWETWTRADLDAWFIELKAHLAQDRYNPGWPQCCYCPRALTCDARTGALKQAVRALDLLEGDADPLGSYHPDGVGRVAASMLERVKDVEAMCARLRGIIKAEVLSHGGVLPIGNGRELAIEQQPRRHVDYGRALPVLTDYLSADAIWQLSELPITKAEKAVSQAAPHRCGAKHVRDFNRRLEAAGAIEITYQDRLEVRRSAVPTPQIQEQPQ